MPLRSRVRPLASLACLCGSLAFVAATPLRAQTLSPALRQQLEEWYHKTTRHASGDWGIAIGTMDGKVLWSAQPELPLVPASTAKVFTTGFARTRVGPEARKTTRVVGVGRLDSASGVWQGAWSIEVTGDPTFERPDRSGPTLRELAADLAAHGVRRLEGPLTITSALGPAEARYPAVWEERYAGKLYAPPIGPVTLHENTVSFTVRPGAHLGAPPVFVSTIPAGAERLVQVRARTVPGRGSRLVLARRADGGWQLLGSVGIGAGTVGFSDVMHDPNIVLDAAWAAALERAGITWERRLPMALPAPGAPRTLLAAVYSAPFDSVASEVNRRSLNVGAEMLLLWGAGRHTHPAELVARHVREVVGPLAKIHLVDGSGLSELNRVTPLTQMLYLAKMPQRPGQQNFPLLLPANGTGTLRHLRYGMGSGVVHAKTGTLDDAATLTGYLGRADGVLVVSLMYNGRRTGAARAAQWDLFRLLGADGVSIPAILETQLGGPQQLGGPSAGGR
ncbi:MAG TPA: D-alanyl-D-alanine carboxypeptidase/D-alanyl-D-alanine-endopeptidase [Gemmatimonadales bacterium]|nr:D-alanyl-D-alanine carboxypeptidase/D-alanyl-D-alanine-endopeptidase [Gemmatimonadales bacterium]